MPERAVVLVTGASGLVGRALRSVVEAEAPGDGAFWIWLRSADGDLCDAQAVAKLFETHKPTHVVHLAAHVGGLFANMARAQLRAARIGVSRAARRRTTCCFTSATPTCARPRARAPAQRGCVLRETTLLPPPALRSYRGAPAAAHARRRASGTRMCSTSASSTVRPACAAPAARDAPFDVC
jgi:hypothetical protein